MAEQFKGKIINDTDVSLPKLEDYYHNSLTASMDLSKVNGQSFFYVENPPDGEDAVGFNADGTIFTIRAKDAFIFNDYEYFTGSIDGDTISVDVSKCDVGDNEKNKQALQDIVHTEQYKTYSDLGPGYTTQTLEDILTLRFLFINCAEIPHFTIERLRKSAVKNISFSDISHYNTGYTYCICKPELESSNGKAKTKFTANPSNYAIRYNDNELIYYFDNNDSSISNDDENLSLHKCQVWEIGADKFGDANYAYYFVLNKDESKEDTLKEALIARDTLAETIQKASDVRICVSTNALSTSAFNYPQPYNIRYKQPSAFQNILKELYSDLNAFSSDNWYRYSGYNMYGQELYKRALAVVYLKVDLDGQGEQWINLNKYIIKNASESTEINPPVHDGSPLEEANYNYASQNFKPGTYDYANLNYVDNFWTQYQTRFKQDERRKKIQLQAFREAGYSVDESTLYNWTVSIGDVSFFVPPASIKMISQTATERIPLLRAKGSMVKNIEKSDSQIEIDLYFNRSSGINGQPVSMNLWQKTEENEQLGTLEDKLSSQTVIYDMNGLRALISEFKFTPFLPVVNKYINETLGVYAVSLENLTISTVPNFPRLIQAKLTLKKFDYGIYMPEVPDPFYIDTENGEELVNPYALCINYDVMRYYYQKPLQLGNEIAKKMAADSNYTFNSIDFIKDTMFKNRTALMPCNFVDPNIDIYIANEDHLKRLMSIKQNEIRRMRSGINNSFVPNDIQNDIISDIALLYVNKDKPDYTLDKIFAKYNTRRTEVINAIRTCIGDENHKFKLDLTSAGLKNYEIDNVRNFSAYKDIFGEIRDKYILDPFIADLKIAFTDKNREDGSDIVLEVYKENNNDEKNIVHVSLNADYVLDKEDIKDLADQAFVGQTDSDVYDSDEVLKNNELRFYIGNWDFLDKSAYTDYNEIISGMQKPELDKIFCDYCYNNDTALLNANQEAAALKESMDWENARSLKFDLIGDNIRVDQFSAAMANNFSRISTLDSDGKAPQYMGSQDIHISWQITTKDEDFAGLMRGLPEYEAYCMRNYHVVLPSFPIRIDSEFTRMLGVYEVSIEDVVVSTVPNFPDLYQIQVRAISTDRTMRNREALKSLNNNQEYNTEETQTTSETVDTTNANGQSGEILNDQMILSDMQTQVKIYGYEHLNNKLAQAELYPDLELPKIGELNDLGFAFIRYKDKERDANDLFVDPDFYFYYPYLAKAEAIRSVIKNDFSDDLTELEKEQQNIKLTDLTGAQVEVGPKPKLFSGEGNPFTDWTWDPTIDLLKFDTANEKYKEQIEDKKSKKALFDETKRKNRNLDLAEFFPAAIMGDPGRWHISSRLTTTFMENFYLGLCENLKNDKLSNQKDEEYKKRIEELKKFYDEKMTGCKQAVNDLYEYLKTTENSYTDLFTENSPGFVATEEFLDKSSTLEQLYIKLNQMKGEGIANSGIANTIGSIILGPGANILATLNDANNNLVYLDIYRIFQAAWAANTGTYEYNSSIDDDKWEGKTNYYGTLYSKSADEELAGEDPVKSDIKRAGIFNIRRLTYNELLTYLDEDERKEVEEVYKTLDPNEKHYFVLDPYYRLKPDQTDDYLYKCATDRGFCSSAFVRIVFWWLIQLYKRQIYPSIALDVMRDTTTNSAEATQKAKKLLEEKYGETIDVDDTLIQNIKEFAEDNGTALDAGKIFTAVFLAIYDRPLNINNEYYNYIHERNYTALNNKFTEIISQHYRYRFDVNNPEAKLRRFLMALVGYGEVNAAEYLGRKLEVSPAANFITSYNTKLALEAANDPSKYLFHSFYDMCRGDYRGRMVRAFPTFYCIFMDEGKEVGLWKLHDNFYSINAIHEITIVKSRKIASDTCTMVLSNNYSTFTTDDEDGFINYKGADWGELWDSLWNNKDYALREEKRRLAANKVNRAKIQPGIRIHVREGYGSDARELGTVFNGVIAEVSPEARVVTIVAQGNGIELMNPILDDTDADEVQFQDSAAAAIFGPNGGGATPKTILTSFLTTRGGALNAYVNGKYDKNQLFFNIKDEPDADSNLSAIWETLKKAFEDNPYGLRMFGDLDYKDIFPEGEIVQNIYEVADMPYMDVSGMDLYTDKETTTDAPYISFEPRGKTIWDIMHICKSVAPDFITGIADFGFRNTIFFGKPHYYYAYDYIKFNEAWVEKRKPYQQYHIYFSDTDIISNDIKASEKEMKTVATGLYQDKQGFYTRNADVGPMWVDKDIFPEKQRSMLVDTRLKMKGAGTNKSHKEGDENSNPDTGNFLLDFMAGLITNGGGGIVDTITDTVMSIAGPLYEEYLWPTAHEITDLLGIKMQHNKRIAWSVTANALKESTKEMYQGGIIVLGDPTVKPQDRIFISDVTNNMQGQVLVRDVIHTLSSVTGFTTTINVDAISTVDDRDEMYKQTFCASLIGHIGSTTVMMLPAMKVYSNGVKFFGDLKEAYDKRISPEKMKQLKKTIGDTSLGGMAKKFKSVLANSKSISTIGDLVGDGLGLIFKAGAKVVSRYTVGLSVSVLFGNSITDKIYWAVKNHQVLTIFPLRKNGMVYVAGLDGSMGLIYGSPTYNTPGSLEKVFAEYLTVNDQNSEDYNLLVSIFGDDDIMNEAARYNRDYKYYAGDDNNPIGSQQIVESIFLGLKDNPGFHRPQSLLGLSLFPRAYRRGNVTEIKTMNNALLRSHVNSVNELFKETEKRSLQLLRISQQLQPYLKEDKLLEILHDNLNTSSGFEYETYNVKIANKDYEVNGIKRTEPENNNQVIDLPYLSTDAIIVLKEICHAAKEKLSKVNAKDTAQTSQDKNGTKIMLLSALTVNSARMHDSSGYSFSLNGTGLLDGKLKDIVKELYKTTKDELNKNRKENEEEKEPAFEVIEFSGKKEIRINVHPRTPLGDN